MSKLKPLKIVASSQVLRIFSKIEIFVLDLGFNLTGPVDYKKKEPMKIKISDPFIKKYKADYNRYIHKFGDIGILKFYSDENLLLNEMYIFDDDNIYEIELDITEIKREPRKYLSVIIEKINTHQKMPNIISSPLSEVKGYGNVPDELESPKLSLPKEEFIRQMVEYHENQFK